MRIATAGLALLAAAGLAACGGSTTVKDVSSSGGAALTGSTRHVATRTVTRTAIAPSATASAPTSTTTSASGGVGLSTGADQSTSAAAPPCTAANLHLSFLGQQGATGHGELGFALRNTGGAACSTVGYPGVQFLDRAGGDLPTTPTHTTSDFVGHTQLRALNVAVGRSASFRLSVTHAGSNCTTAYGLQVIAPNDTATLKTAIPDGASECATASVSPLQAGDSAYP